MEMFRFREGSTSLVVSMPHSGVHVPDSLGKRLTAEALALPDTDWHVERLYDFLHVMGASVLVATHSRYVVDLNRPPDNASLYPGRQTTGVVPIDTFHGTPIYRRGQEPVEDEVRARVEQYWRPYHTQLAQVLERTKARYEYALLWDAHSISSMVPRLFEGRLPDLNIGTADGRSCADVVRQALLTEVRDYSAVLDGRFKGGYITRAYGKPEENVHAVQLELSKATYMEEAAPYRFREDLADRLRPTLRTLIERFARLVPGPRTG